jgi:fructose-1,6-bisphosphatase/inositol monophosphatase family enzyme
MYEAVDALLREVGANELLARFRRLGDDEIREKSPGEIVTEADLAAERALTSGLRALRPGSVVVGEESCASDPGPLRALADLGEAWVVDPLDGTANFARGEEPFGSIVTLMRHGRAQAGWIHLPTSDTMAFSERGGGAFLNGRRVHLARPPDLDAMRGAMLTRFLPEPLKSHVEAIRPTLDAGLGVGCAAQRYVDLLRGREDFALFYRTLPWDHATGALIYEEAGGLARRFDASPYKASDVDASGLLLAPDEASWRWLRERLIPSELAQPS